MKKTDLLTQLLEKGNGYIKTSDVLNLDISNSYFYEYVADHSLIRVARGLYKAEYAWDDILYEISTLNQQVCFSHETALYLNDLMEREPFEITVTAPRGYNATHLRKRQIRVYQLKKQLYLLGKSELNTPFGNKVNAYNRERSICDLLRYKEKTDIQIFQAAFKLYFERQDKNIPLLMQYAQKFNLEETMRKYMEVLL
ncbi:MAG: type IV toxin-antitoxin system AbiEi family antitoxin domain-containing protein [Saccharofermentanales bacterium]|jgi:predicted transcriptional regulator of viral defense system